MKEEKSYPLISIVMPIYNSAKFLRKSIPSVIAQEYPNLEIVLLNNGSTDESVSIIEEYAKQDERIKVYTIEHVGTPKESRDNAVYRAKGEWIIPVDSDDSIEPRYVVKLWKRREETDADCVCATMVFGDEECKERSYIPSDSFFKQRVFGGAEAMIHTLFEWKFGLNGFLIKKEILEKVNILSNPNRKYYTDECDSRILLDTSKMVAISNAKYFYYSHPASTGKKTSAVSILYGLITLVGLYNYFQGTYGENSILTIGCAVKLQRVFRNTLVKLLQNFRVTHSQLTIGQRTCIIEAYEILKKNGKYVGKQYKCINIVLYRLSKLI